MSEMVGAGFRASGCWAAKLAMVAGREVGWRLMQAFTLLESRDVVLIWVVGCSDNAEACEHGAEESHRKRVP